MRPENEYSKEQLDSVVANLNSDDLPKLKVIEEEVVQIDNQVKTKWVKYSVRIPDDGAKTDEMYQRLKAQNGGLNTEDWKIDNKRVFDDEGIVWFVLRVPENAHKFISGKNGYLFYGLTKVRFICKDGEVQADEYVGKRRIFENKIVNK